MNKLSDQERQTIIEAGHVLGLVDFSILEKDHFVTKAIHTIAKMNHPEIDLIFCGGTCLAKAHKIIARMSEDIDFKIVPKRPFLSSSEQRRKLRDFRNQITSLLQLVGFEVNENNIKSRDNNSYIVYFLEFPASFEQHQHLKPHIQLEFTLAYPRLPSEIKSITSITADIFPDETNSNENIHCVAIMETAAEKWVALTRRIAAIARGHDPMDETLVRHLYDLYAITLHSDVTEDFFLLAIETIKRDQLKFKRHHEYIDDPLQEIQYSITTLVQDPIWIENYNNFIASMVFDKNDVSFDKCCQKLRQLTNRIVAHPMFLKVEKIKIS